MARGINKVTLIGNLGADPEYKILDNGTHIANLNIATSEKWKDKEGKDKEQTEWHKVTVFGKLAEIAADYLKRGSRVYIEGSLSTQEYVDKKDNIKRWTTTIKARELLMLGDGKGSTHPIDQATETYENVPF